MILAAGFGTRLKPLTDTKPKALIEINEMTLLEIVLRRLKKYGFEEVIINVHHFAEQIIEFLKEKECCGVKISLSDESEKLLDTGGGLKKTGWFFNDKTPFVVHNVDVISDLDLINLYEAHQNSNSIITLAVRNRKSSRYLLFDENDRLCGWENMNTGERKIMINTDSQLVQKAYSGIQVLNPEIFDLMPEKEVFSIIDFYLELAKEHKITSYNHDETLWLDLGKIDNLEEAKIIMRNFNNIF